MTDEAVTRNISVSCAAVSGPTQNYSEASGSKWVDRVWAARTLRFVLWAIPVAGSFLVVSWLSRNLSPARIGVHVALWWLLAAGAGAATIVLLDRAMRRFLPMVSLLRMSMVFPDKAPARYRAALHSGSGRSLERRMRAISAATPGQIGAQRTLLLLDLAAAITRHDRYTRGHCERVRAYSDLIAEELGLDDHDRGLLRWAALLHDVGKLDVPTAILNKPGRPDDDEWAVLAGHPEAAAAYLAPVETWLDGWQAAASQHHERWDGGGYPAGLADESIHIAGRIVAVADAYDTMVTVRSYKKAMTPEAARRELVSCAGGQFDPRVVRAFVNVSIGRVRRAAGGLTWFGNLGQFVGSGTVSPAVSSVPNVVASGLLVAGGFALSPGLSAVGNDGAEEASIIAIEQSALGSQLSLATTPTATKQPEAPAGLAGESGTDVPFAGRPDLENDRATPEPTPTPTRFATPTATLLQASPTVLAPGATPDPTGTVEVIPFQTATPTATAQSRSTVAPTATPAVSANPSVTPVVSSTPIPTRAPAATATPTQLPVPSATTSPTPSPTEMATSTEIPTATATPSATATPTATATPRPVNQPPTITAEDDITITTDTIEKTFFVLIEDPDGDALNLTAIDLFGTFTYVNVLGATTTTAPNGSGLYEVSFGAGPWPEGTGWVIELMVEDDGNPNLSTSLYIGGNVVAS